MTKILINENGKALMNADGRVYKAPEQDNRLNQHLKGELTEITLDDLEGVNAIPTYAFNNCKKLDKIEIPNSVKKFYNCAFPRNADYKDLYYYGTLEEWLNIVIASDLNYLTTPMTSVTNFYVKDSEGNFYELSGELTIPSNVTTILQESLYGLKKVTKVNLNNVTELEKYALSYTEITELYGQNVITLGQFSLKSNNNLTKIELPLVETIVGYCAGFNRYLNTVIISNAKAIEKYAFEACFYLKKVLIEQTDSVCTLNSTAFTRCHHILGTNETGAGNDDLLKDGYIYVPASLLSQYKVATNWVKIETQIIGHQDFNVGDTLPSYANDTYTTCTWYSDETLQNVVTSVETQGRYYCRLEA